MNKKQKIIVSITGIFIVLLALVGLTYAYFLTRITGNENDKSISVTTANLQLVYADSNGILQTGKLEPSNDYITFLDSEGNEHESKIFTVTNIGNATIEGYKVYLENVQNQFERKDDLVYTLSCKSYINYDKATKEISGQCTGVNTETTFPSVITSIVSNDIAVGITHEYELKVKYIEMGVDQSVDMNKLLRAKINIYDERTKFLATEIMNNATSGVEGNTSYTLPTELPTKIAEEVSGAVSYLQFGEDNTVKISELECILEDGVTPITWYTSENYTGFFNGNYHDIYSFEEMIGKYVNSECDYTNIKYVESYDSENFTITYRNVYPRAEQILSYTLDDLGTSYYYRGDVEDNYVNFAGMCWRIVRIDGNGNTKIILEDQDEVCSTTMNGNWDIEASDGTSITLNGSDPYRTGNFGYDDSTGKFKMSYLNPVDNSNRAMVDAFKYFQTNTLSNKISSTYTNKTITDYLVSGNWCLNNKAYSDSTGTTLLENLDYSSEFYYDSYVRLYGKTTKEPTLKCPVDTMETFGDNTTPMYVGTLTADEMVYAGAISNVPNENYYLVNAWQSSNYNHFWSLSPFNFSYHIDYAFFMNAAGFLDSAYVESGEVKVNHSFRPSVSLASSVSVTTNSDTATYGQPGTINNPYVIS